MNTIRLTENDLRMMVHSAVTRILRESADEVKGSIMAEKENEIEKLVNIILKWWENAKHGAPEDSGTFGINGVGDNIGNISVYSTIIPREYTVALGISDDFQMYVKVMSYTLPEEHLRHFGQSERSTQGASYGGDEFTKYSETTMKFKKSRIDLFVPAINGELQTRGLYSTLYHELNHAASTLNISRQAQDKGNTDLIGKNMMSAANKRSVGELRHAKFMSALNPPHPFAEFGNKIRFGSDYEKFRAANFILYGLWEITELNARAEGMYGELQHAKITKDQFEEFYQHSSLKYNIEQFRELLNTVMEADDKSQVWVYLGEMIHEKSPGRTKKRFASRTAELINKLYKKGMRVADLYFERHKPKAPGM